MSTPPVRNAEKQANNRKANAETQANMNSLLNAHNLQVINKAILNYGKPVSYGKRQEIIKEVLRVHGPSPVGNALVRAANNPTRPALIALAKANQQAAIKASTAPQVIAAVKAAAASQYAAEKPSSFPRVQSALNAAVKVATSFGNKMGQLHNLAKARNNFAQKQKMMSSTSNIFKRRENLKRKLRENVEKIRETTPNNKVKDMNAILQFFKNDPRNPYNFNAKALELQKLINRQREINKIANNELKEKFIREQASRASNRGNNGSRAGQSFHRGLPFTKQEMKNFKTDSGYNSLTNNNKQELEKIILNMNSPNKQNSAQKRYANLMNKSSQKRLNKIRTEIPDITVTTNPLFENT